MNSPPAIPRPITPAELARLTDRELLAMWPSILAAHPELSRAGFGGPFPVRVEK